MNSKTAARRAARATLIPVFLIVLGIFAWGMRYKLSLYDAPGSPRSIAQAKLLSPNERPDWLRNVAQFSPQLLRQHLLRPQLLGATPPFLWTVVSAALCLGILLIRAQAAACRAARLSRHSRAHRRAHRRAHHGCESVASFFFFRPPPAITLAQ